uniref:Uncharacterized protein n=1 Tax=Oryzias latipes TaxID=8090 RepID=A0A3P9L6J3_ORYLA
RSPSGSAGSGVWPKQLINPPGPSSEGCLRVRRLTSFIALRRVICNIFYTEPILSRSRVRHMEPCSTNDLHLV